MDSERVRIVWMGNQQGAIAARAPLFDVLP
jgi:hypothetical protein